MEERLQKILAQAGIASRRAAEKYITEGRVRVNGEVVSDLGAKADPDNDTIEVDGYGVVAAEPLVYVAMHKPIHVMTTLKDPEKRQTIIDVMEMTRATGPKSFEGNMPRIFPVGRLDFDAEGLLILTNDGALSNDLLHPRYHVPKTYVVKVRGRPDPRALDRVRRGVRLREEDGTMSRPTAPAEVNIVRESPANTWLEVIIHEGRHHQVKRMFEAVGVQLIRLIRTEFGGIELGELDVGYWRFLTDAEVELLRAWRQGNVGELLAKKRGPRTSEMMFGKPSAKGTTAKAYRRDKTESGYGAPRERAERGAPRGESRGEGRGRPMRDGAAPHGEGRGRPMRDGTAPRGEGRGRPMRDGTAPRGEGRGRPMRDGAAPRGEGRGRPMRDAAAPRGEGYGRPVRDGGASRGEGRRQPMRDDRGPPRGQSRGQPMRDGAPPRGQSRGRPMRDGAAPRGDYGAPRGEGRGRPMRDDRAPRGEHGAPRASRGAGAERRGPGAAASRAPRAGARGPSAGSRGPRAGGRGPSAGSRGPRSGGSRGGPRR